MVVLSTVALDSKAHFTSHVITGMCNKKAGGKKHWCVGVTTWVLSFLKMKSNVAIMTMEYKRSIFSVIQESKVKCKIKS